MLRGLLRRKSVVLVLTLVLTALIGVLDYATGREVAISAFYLIPICWACWRFGRNAGMGLAAASVAAWFIADLTDHYNYPHSAIPYWNAFMLLALYMVVAYLLSAFKTAHLQQREAVAALRSVNENLESLVERRTAALQAEIAERKRLEAAKIQAERLAVVGTMAAEVAHEVRNPLGSIILNLDLIQKELGRFAQLSRQPPTEGHLLVDEIRVEVRRIQHVIEDYLQFARIPKPQRQPVMLNELLDQKLAFMNGAFTEARVRLQTAFDPALQVVNADGEQLWQATLNLIRNGLQAMPSGGDLTVSTARDGDEAHVRVMDNGRGMTPEQVRQVFVPFFTTKREGTGLGLTVVQQIASEHGGRVECQSEAGKGSTFTLCLPLNAAS